MRTVIVAVFAAIMSLTSLGTSVATAAPAGAMAVNPGKSDRSLIVNVQRRGGLSRGGGRARSAGRAVRRGGGGVRRGYVRRGSVRRGSVRRAPRGIARRTARRGGVVRRGRARRIAPRRRGYRGRRIIRYGLYAAPALSYYYYDVYPRRCARYYRKWRLTGSRYWRRRFINCMNRYYW